MTGNRKACQAACEALSQEAAALFGVRFDHALLEIEEDLTDESEGGAGRLEQGVPAGGEKVDADDAPSACA